MLEKYFAKHFFCCCRWFFVITTIVFGLFAASTFHMLGFYSLATSAEAIDICAYLCDFRWKNSSIFVETLFRFSAIHRFFLRFTPPFPTSYQFFRPPPLPLCFCPPFAASTPNAKHFSVFILAELLFIVHFMEFCQLFLQHQWSTAIFFVYFAAFSNLYFV